MSYKNEDERKMRNNWSKRRIFLKIIERMNEIQWKPRQSTENEEKNQLNIIKKGNKMKTIKQTKTTIDSIY